MQCTLSGGNQFYRGPSALYLYVCVRERAVCVCLCAKLHCMQVESLKMIVLRHSLCPIHDVGGWRLEI